MSAHVRVYARFARCWDWQYIYRKYISTEGGDKITFTPQDSVGFKTHGTSSCPLTSSIFYYKFGVNVLFYLENISQKFRRVALRDYRRGLSAAPATRVAGFSIRTRRI